MISFDVVRPLRAIRATLGPSRVGPRSSSPKATRPIPRWTRFRPAGFPLLLAVAAALASRPSSALDPSKRITQYSHDVWLDELPQNTPQVIAQTRDGYLWIGTYDGLLRFDGVRFKVFDSSRTRDLRGTGVFDLLEDRDGTLWICTNGGLTALRNGRFTHLTRDDGLPSNLVNVIAEAPDGTRWIGTDRGLVHHARGRFTVLTTKDGLPGDAIRSLRFDRNGSLWIATDRGLARLAGDRFELFGKKNGLPSELVRALCLARDGSLWFGTGDGLVRHSDGRFRVWKTREGSSNAFVRSVHEDRAGNIWFGTEDGGLGRLTYGTISRFTVRQGLTHNFVRSIYEDREGSLWVGTSAGLNRFRDGKFRCYTTQEGLPADYVRTILAEPDGTIWIGSDGGGLTRWKDDRFRTLREADGLVNDSVRSLHRGRDGSLWIGTRGGVSHLKKGRFTSYTKREGLSLDLVRAVWEDSHGVLWVGTEGGGLNRLAGGRFSQVTAEAGLVTNDVRVITEDRRGSIWVGGYGGLSRLRDGVIRNYTTGDGLVNDTVFSIHEDSAGTLWFGTDGGLSRFDGARFTNFTIENGLFENKTFQILEDGTGNFWLTSNRGISRVAGSELEAVAAGRKDRVAAVGFDKADGLTVSQCNGASQPAGARAPDGRLWIPMIRGIVVVDPSALRPNEIPPNVVIEEVLVDGREIDLGAGGELAPGSEKLEIHYTGLSFLAPQKVRFRYQLVGFDRGWIDAGNRRTAWYTNLPPGAYQFRVTGCNNDGLWSETTATCSFHLAAPWWRSPRALALALVALAGSIWIGVRIRLLALERTTRRLEAMVGARTEELDEKIQELLVSRRLAVEANQAKSAFLQSMSHELRTPLNSIIGFSQILLDRLRGQVPDRQLGFLANINRSGERLLGLISDILDVTRIEAEELELLPEPISARPLLESVRDLAMGLAEKKRMRVEISVPADLPPLVVDPGKLKQILLNLLSNAVKFSPAESGVELVARALDPDRSPLGLPSVAFEVVDQGIGIAPENHQLIFEEFRQIDSGTSRKFEGAGLGLSIVSRLVGLLGGAIEVDSELGQGSTFRVILPLEPARGSESRPTAPIGTIGPNAAPGAPPVRGRERAPLKAVEN
jgi:signal transduction histidine kinase/ligand-binding sensor domain-containing protein